MATSATLKFTHLSPQKMRLVADQIRGMSVDRAINLLAFSNKKGAVIVKKVLESAIANAENNDGADIDEVKIRSNWIVDQVDVQGWAHCFISEDADNLVQIGRGAHILALLTPPADTKQRIADAYWAWLEEKILGPIKEQFPDVYRWLVDWYRKELSKLADAAVVEGEMS